MSDVIIPLCTGAECTFETLELDGNDGMDWNCPDRKFWSEGVKLAVRQIFVDRIQGRLSDVETFWSQVDVKDNRFECYGPLKHITVDDGTEIVV